MPARPDERFDVPEEFGDGSVWADRAGVRSLVGSNQRGVTIRIGHGPGEISPGELLKLALIGCAGMSSDLAIGRRLGEDFPMRLYAHGESSDETNRYETVLEQIQLDLSGLDEEQADRVRTVAAKAVEVGCTVERSVVPGFPVEHEILDSEDRYSDEDAQS